mmetsp:Transcript_22037/g.48940  ORF Transcript_22037/g.48940 Transcript_22037/m.48940 type:complete len:1773 (+) Transcript_22037:56-5374(+)
MATGSFAIVYFIFAITFVLFNLRVQKTDDYQRIYESTIQRMASRPFTPNYPLFMDDIANPQQLYAWLYEVVLSTTYAETTVAGDNRWCNSVHQCGVGEGGCHLQDDCAGNLYCNKTGAEGKVFVHDREWLLLELIEYCASRATPVLPEVNVLQPCIIPHAGEASASSVGYCCFDPLEGRPIQVIWGHPGANYTVDADRGCNDDVMATSNCCLELPENEGSNTTTNQTADSTIYPVIGSYNTPLMYRFELQRFEVRQNEHGRFSDEYPMRTMVPMIHAQSHTTHGQNRDDIQGPSNQTYVWDTKGSLNEAGGFVQFVDPQDGREAMQTTLSDLLDAGWFNSQMATFTFDFILYNSNSKAYLHSGWIFAFTHAGTVEIDHFANGFASEPFETWSFNFTLRIILLLVTILFCVQEALKTFTDGCATHFKHWTAFLDIFSQALCLTVLIFSFVLDDVDVYSDSFSFESLQDPAQTADVFHELEVLGDLNEVKSFMVALNLLVVFCRAVMIIAKLDGELGLIFDTLDYAKENLLSLTMVYCMILLGFVTFAFFLFGGNSEEFGTVPGAVFQTFVMLIGQPNFYTLQAADALMAPIFFFSFYVLMFFVMINMFISILMNGYDQASDVLAGKPKENIIKKTLQELKVNWVGACIKYFVGFLNIIKAAVMPIIKSFADCCPGTSRLSLGRCKFWGRHGADGAPTTPKDSSDRTKKDEDDGVKGCGQGEVIEFLLLVVFMLIFVIFINLQSRGAESFENGMTTSLASRTSEWVQPDPARVDTLSDVRTMEDVLPWTRTVLAELYDSPFCAQYPRTDEESMTLNAWRSEAAETPVCAPATCAINATFPNFTDTLSGLNFCDNVLDDRQLVNTVGGWNIGFLNTTFVRITIQPACYENNYDPTTRAAVPYLRVTPDVLCSESDCTSSEALDGKSCLDADGESIDMTNFEIGLDPTKIYNYSKPGDLGPYGLHGGLVVSLPPGRGAMWAQMAALTFDNWFSKNSASMVLDYITYNGNLDMFAYNRVSFDLRSTGELEKSVDMFIFPLHITSGGGYYAGERVAAVILFVFYVLLLIYYTCSLVGVLFRKFRRQQGTGAPFYGFLLDHYSNPWHISDSISQIISVISLAITVMFALNTFRDTYKFSVNAEQKYEIPNDDVKEFGMVAKVSEARPMQEDWYIFYQFEQLSSLYGNFLTIAALNSFFISIKVVKYVANLEVVRVFSKTLTLGMKRTGYFVCVLVTLSFGWALFFNVLYGKYERDLADLLSACVTLVNWLLGVDAPNNILRIAPIALIWWAMYMMFFYFIMTNMFLATMINRYADTEGKIDIERTDKEVKSLQKLTQAEYESATAFDEDIRRLSVTGGQGKDVDVVVEELAEGGIAQGKGVRRGYIIAKVQQDQDSWKAGISKDNKDSPDAGQVVKQAILDLMTKEDGVDIKVDFQEADEEKQGINKWLENCFRRHDDAVRKLTITPTCKNCWQLHGAVTWMYKKVQNEDKKNMSSADRDEDLLDEENEDDDGEGLEEKQREEEMRKKDATRKSARAKCKKMLDALLFSRAVEGRFDKDASTENDKGPEAAKANERKRHLNVFWPEHRGEIEVVEDDKDSIGQALQSLPVSGFEVWLDCLMTAIEKEWSEESVVSEVLRTNDMQDLARQAVKGQSMANRDNYTFMMHASDILESLEFKAKQRYYKMLEEESNNRQQHLHAQNEVLYDYVCELEEEFKKIMGSIHSYKDKKRMMLSKLGDLLGTDAPGSSSRAPALTQGHDRQHMARLTSPWPESRGTRS